MKAAVLHQFGQLPAYTDFERPEALPGERVITVRAAALKQLDRAIAAGTHYGSPQSLPVACGTDGVGVLDDGSRVYFNAYRRPFGAMAEQAPASFIVPVPDALDDLHAAALVNPALAAWLPLKVRGRMMRGETVLIMGATGAAGRFAVRVARLLGAGRIVAAGRRQDVLDALGADETIDLAMREEAMAQAFAREIGRGVHVVLDYVWGRPAEIFLAQLANADLAPAETAHTVRYVSIGEMAGSTIALQGNWLRGSRLEIMGSGSANFPEPAVMKDIVSDIFAHATKGDLPLDVDPVPLASVADAWSGPASAESRTVLTVG